MTEPQGGRIRPVTGMLAVGGLVRAVMALGELFEAQEREILRLEGLTPAQRDMLVALKSHGPGTVATLGRIRGCSRQNARVLVGALVGRGYLRLAPNPLDRRARLVEITVAGKEGLRRILHREGEVLTRLAGSLPGDQARQAGATLRKLTAILTGDGRA